MRLGLLSDVHGNPLALDACLAALARFDVDALHFLGDVVGYMPGEVECLDALRAASVECQQGNHEAMMLSPTPDSLARDSVYGLAAAGARLDESTLSMVRAWPTRRELDVDGRSLLLVHGSPQDPLNGYVYPDADLSLTLVPGFDAIVMGHTHRPFTAAVGDALLVNVGSVGLPRDVGHLAAFGVYESEANRCTIHRVKFAADAVLARWGEDLAEITKACLARRALRFEGEVIR